MMEKMRKVFLKYWWVGVLTVVSVLLLVWKLDRVPRGMDGDEVAVGYYGYSLLKYGSDEYGIKWPVYFKSIGDYKYPMYSYLSMIPVALMGLNVVSSKMVAVLSGLSILFSVNWWLWKYTKSAVVVVAATLTAWGSIWWLLFSRGAYESILGVALVMGVTLLINMRKKWGWRMLLVITGLLIAAELSYPATRLFLLGFLGWRLLVVKDKKRAGVLFAVVLMITAGLMFDPQSRVRASGLFVGNDASMWEHGRNQIWEVGSAIPGRFGWLQARIWDNKYVIVSRAIGERYLAHFDPVYLFMTGNPTVSKYTVPFCGMMPLASLGLILMGFVYLVNHWHKDEDLRVWAGFLLLSPLSSALTLETTSQVRSLLMMPVLLVLAGLGIKRRTGFGIVIGLLLLINASYVWKQYFIHREQHQPWMLGQGLPEMVQYVMANNTKYESVAMGGDPYIYFLFYGAGDAKWQFNRLKYNANRQWDSVTSINNVVFGMRYNCPKLGKENVLYICKGEEVPLNGVVKHVSYYNDGVPAYSAIEFVPLSSVKQRPELPRGFNYMVESDIRLNGLLPKTSSELW